MKINFKQILFVLLLISCLLSISAISASDLADDSDFALDESYNIASDNIDILETDLKDNSKSLLKESSISENKDSLKDSSNTLHGGSFDDIQSAIDSSNDGDEIVLDGTFTSNGNLIVVNKSLTFTGSNAVLNGKNISKIFLVESDYVKLINLTLINGKSKNETDLGPYQGTVNWQGSNGIVENCSFINNTGGEKSYGASIYWHGANGQILNSNFINSYATLNGGAVFALCDNLTILNSTFKNNHGQEGGAVYLGGSAPIYIINCLFVNNTADLGGALAACSMYRQLINSTFINNSAADGGAVSWCGSRGEIVNSTFKNNTASNKGGAIYFSARNNLVKNSIFINNSANAGGAINSYNKLNYISNLQFENNTAESGKDYYGDIEFKRQNSSISSEDMLTTAINYLIDGRNGEYFNVVLKDEDGNPIKGKPIKIGFNGKVYNKTTNSNGIASLQINLKAVGTYTFAICFLSDDDFYASFVVNKITVNYQKPTLTTSNFQYKSTAKTKTIKASLKTSRGNALSGKTVTFTVNNKAYSAKTNSNGVASISVSLSSKKTYSFSVKYEGDDTYSAISKSAKLIIN